MIIKLFVILFSTLFSFSVVAQELDTSRTEIQSTSNTADTTKPSVEARNPQVVFEGELEIAGMEKTKLDYIFYKGDEILLTANPVKGKDISRFVFQRGNQSIISQYKSKPNLELRFTIPETDAYSFIFENTAFLSSKILLVHISRLAINDSLQTLDVAFGMETLVDTSYTEVLNKTIRLGRGILAPNIVTASLDIPRESDGNVAIIIGSEKEVSEWLVKATSLAPVDPVTKIIAGTLMEAVQSTGGNEVNWYVTDANNARLAIDGSPFNAFYISLGVSFETKALKLDPGKTYYLVLANPSTVSAKDIKVLAKAQIIRTQTRPLIPKK
jgi:hypothetical protein